MNLSSACGLLTIAAALAWSYATPIKALAERWANEPDYNHGFLVPIFSLYLLWYRRHLIDRSRLRGSWWGLPLVALAAWMRWQAAYLFYPTMDAPSLLPCLTGIVILWGGWHGFRWAWPSILFLAFMMPLPAAIAGLFSHRLQRIATICSTWLLQLFGVPAISSGNIIRLTDGSIGVVEACSGLRMLLLFLAITVGAAFLIRRPIWEKTFVALSALAISVVTNIMRITVTALLYEYVGKSWAQMVFHDLAGWLMMPIATLLLGIELWILSRLLVTPTKSEPIFVKR
jgi:exosortase